MAAGVYNFNLEQGVLHTFTITYKDKDDQVISLAGFNVAGGFKLKMSDPEPLAFFQFEMEPELGQIKVVIPSDALAGIVLKANSFDDYVPAVYDIYLVKVGEVPEYTRLLNGTINISPQVTKYD